MKQQWTLIFALVFALIIAIFSVMNVEAVPVDYMFGTAHIPLIMVILGSALAGGFVVGLFGTIRIMKQNRQIRSLQKELQSLKSSSVAKDPAQPQPPAPAKTDGEPAEDPK